jgi:putative transposase
MPCIGGRKLHYLLEPHFRLNGITMGRDGLFRFMREHGLLIKPRRRYYVTTDSNHWLHKYPNLLTELMPTGREQVLVSDITYIDTEEGFAYLFLVTDAYSRKIMGFHVGSDMKAESALVALIMALNTITHCHGIIHHSDRGVQYCSTLYVDELTKRHMLISMTEPSSPTQNAIAERVNGILKTEWIYQMRFKTVEDARVEITKIIQIYNNERPHDSLGKLTPAKAHETNAPLKKNWVKKLFMTSHSTKAAGDLEGIRCSECHRIQNDHSEKEWPSCDIRHRPQVIPQPGKSPQARPPLHQGEAKVLPKSQNKRILLQTT